MSEEDPIYFNVQKIPSNIPFQAFLIGLFGGGGSVPSNSRFYDSTSVCVRFDFP